MPTPTRRYQSLRSFEDLPELPSGYPLMFSTRARFRPLWYAVMDRRRPWTGRTVTSRNSMSCLPMREQLMRRYAPEQLA